MKEFNFEDCCNPALSSECDNFEEVEFNEDEMNIDVMIHYQDRLIEDPHLEVQEEHKLLHESMDSLPLDEATVLEMRYGFLEGKTYSYGDIGNHLGFSDKKIKALEAKALYKLRGLMDPEERKRRIFEGYKDLLKEILA